MVYGRPRSMVPRWVPRGRHMGGTWVPVARQRPILATVLSVRLPNGPDARAASLAAFRATGGTCHQRFGSATRPLRQRVTNGSAASEQAGLHIHQCTSRAVRLASAGASGSVGSAAVEHLSLVGLVAGGLRPAYRLAVAEGPLSAATLRARPGPSGLPAFRGSVLVRWGLHGRDQAAAMMPIASAAVTMRMPWWVPRVSRSRSPETIRSAWAATAAAMT